MVSLYVSLCSWCAVRRWRYVWMNVMILQTWSILWCSWRANQDQPPEIDCNVGSIKKLKCKKVQAQTCTMFSQDLRVCNDLSALLLRWCFVSVKLKHITCASLSLHSRKWLGHQVKSVKTSMILGNH